MEMFTNPIFWAIIIPVSWRWWSKYSKHAVPLLPVLTLTLGCAFCAGICISIPVSVIIGAWDGGPLVGSLGVFAVLASFMIGTWLIARVIDGAVMAFNRLRGTTCLASV